MAGNPRVTRPVRQATAMSDLTDHDLEARLETGLRRLLSHRRYQVQRQAAEQAVRVLEAYLQGVPEHQEVTHEQMQQSRERLDVVMSQIAAFEREQARQICIARDVRRPNATADRDIAVSTIIAAIHRLPATEANDQPFKIVLSFLNGWMYVDTEELSEREVENLRPREEPTPEEQQTPEPPSAGPTADQPTADLPSVEGTTEAQPTSTIAIVDLATMPDDQAGGSMKRDGSVDKTQAAGSAQVKDRGLSEEPTAVLTAAPMAHASTAATGVTMTRSLIGVYTIQVEPGSDHEETQRPPTPGRTTPGRDRGKTGWNASPVSERKAARVATHKNCRIGEEEELQRCKQKAKKLRHEKKAKRATKDKTATRDTTPGATLTGGVRPHACPETETIGEAAPEVPIVKLVRMTAPVEARAPEATLAEQRGGPLATWGAITSESEELRNPNAGPGSSVD